MKILWIVNTIFGLASQKLFNRDENGVWMQALLDDFKKNKTFDIVVATTTPLKEKFYIKDSNIEYYVLPGQDPILYNENDKKNITIWKEFLEVIKPDLIVVWGTEFSHGLCALRQAINIPSLIYVQGLASSIAMHYTAGMSHSEIVKNRTFRDFVKHDDIYNRQKVFYKQSINEKEMFKLAKGVIVENKWAAMTISSICPNVSIYYCPLNINSVFSKYKWDLENSENHSLMCNAPGYPLKGLHMVLRALFIVREKYPDVKLYIPGYKLISNNTFNSRIRKNGYTKFIESIIKKYNLEDNIVWLGTLTQEELAKKLSLTRIFILASSIENHSSSLKEAMIVGVPCVASAVGGIPEYVTNEENGFLYRFEEYGVLAGYIDRIFSDDILSKNISKNARIKMTKIHSSNDIFEKTVEIYREAIKAKNI